MPASAISALQLLQWGEESTLGSAVAATSKIACEGITFTPTDTVVRPKVAKGILAANPGNETHVMRGTDFSVAESPVVYDQLQQWLSMSVAGAVAASGAPSVYTWAYARSMTADPAPDSRTIERRLSDGTDFIDNEWAYCLLRSLRFIYRTDQPLMFSAEGFARRIQGSTLTAGQALPTIEIPPAALATVKIDSSWATVGQTAVSSQVLSADVLFKTGLAPKMSLDGRSDLDFTTYILNPELVNLDVTLRMLIKTSSGQFATEKTAAEAAGQTLRAVRLNVLGTGSRQLQIDMLLKHERGSLQTISTEDGQDIVEMKLVGATDATNLLNIVLINSVNTLT